MIAFPDWAPSPLVPLADLFSPDVEFETVHAFADRLADLPTRAWLEVGHSILRNGSSHARATASALLAAAINGRGLAVAAWYACDAIETSAFYASRAHRWTLRDRRAFAAARSAAEDAALALLAGRFVSADDRATLVAPFEPLARQATRAA